MAKKKARGPARELTRAEKIAFERRASSVAVSAPVAEAEPEPVAAPVGAGARRGVLPPRRAVYGAPTLTREQELNYIRGDLRRLTILGLLMTALLVALTFFLR